MNPLADKPIVPDAYGLSDSQVETLRAKHGWNELPSAPAPSPLRIFFRQFTSFLIIILILAGVIAYFLGDRADTLAIALVVIMNGVLGFVQEWRAETALEALRNILSPQAIVLRNGVETMLDAREIVPGDIIYLNAGDKVPADAVPVSANELNVDESVLTGESLPVLKDARSAEAMLFAGTSIVSGRAEARVNAIGAGTALGKIANLTGSVGQKTTQLQVQLGRLATQLGLTALAIAAAILAVGLYVERDPVEMMMTALSLSVAMVPEGLPAVVTITLALGASAMARQKALVRKLQAVETLGAASVICTDKTGTLTENKMTATEIWTPLARYNVTGTGYDPAGHIALDGARVRAKDSTDLANLLNVAIRCTHAKLNHSSNEWRITGVPTEAALVVLAYKGWADLPASNDIVLERPFSGERKRMSVLVKDTVGMKLLTKGAPEIVLDLCTQVMENAAPSHLTTERKAEIKHAYEEMAGRGLRVVALAMRDAAPNDTTEENLTFLGLVGLLDPPRPEVRKAISAAQNAGIKIIMITGDSPVTATAIAGQLGLNIAKTLTGDALEAMSEQELSAALEDDVLFARTRPADKMRIVAALQNSEKVVAMTGDGVNDAPALKQADIGISMGIRGTDVAKDASDLVLLDDNFATIVRAIREGRRQFSNVKKFVRYLLSSNTGEVVAILANIIIGGPLIFLATQILWMNLVTDGATAVALGLEKAERRQMREPPRPKSAPILGIRGIATIGAFGIYTGFASLWIFITLLPMGEAVARTTAFTAMVVFEKISVFAFRSLSQPCWRIGWFSNPLLLLALSITLCLQVAAVYWPPMQALLHTVPIGQDHWIMIGLFALPLLIVPEILKSILGLHAAPKALSTSEE